MDEVIVELARIHRHPQVGENDLKLDTADFRTRKTVKATVFGIDSFTTTSTCRGTNSWNLGTD